MALVSCRFRVLHRRLSATALCALLAAPPVAAQPAAVDPQARMPRPTTAQIDDTLAIGGQQIDGRKVRGRMTVPVRINNTGPYRFVVDSGADTSVVGERIARALALPPAGKVMLNGVTESALVERAEVDELAVGPTAVSGLQLPVLREVDIGADGIIGLDALAEQRLMLDFEKRTITVDEARRPPPRLDGEIVVTARLRRGQLILTQVKAGTTPVEAVVDTGAEVTIGNNALRERLAKRFRGKIQTVGVTGVTGATQTMDVIVLPELKLGSVILQNVPIAFADVTPFHVFGMADRPALLLGADLMETFRKVSLDFRARKVRFQLRRCDAQRVAIGSATSGSRILTDGSSPGACAR